METNNRLSSVLFVPHGAGPLPLLGDSGHQGMVTFLKKITRDLGMPSAIVVISAHWEEDVVTITSGETPSLIYDYSGFPAEAYAIKYPARGKPALAKKIDELLRASGIAARLDDQRGFDHGLYVPLKVMFPDANIPCVQVSLLNSLDAQAHIDIGKALSGLKDENVLLLGSGMSFHNMKVFMSKSTATHDEGNEAFEHWLIDICTSGNITEVERERRLAAWSSAPYARYCHPREEHLLPLHVCYGFSSSGATLVFDDDVLGKKTSAFCW